MFSVRDKIRSVRVVGATTIPLWSYYIQPTE